jgi:DNA modification methylase
MVYKNKIVGHEDIDPSKILANPLNPREHPEIQISMMDGILKDVGWLTEIIVNKNNMHIVDGLMRHALAIYEGEETVPITWVDLTDEEERKALLTFNPVAMLAKQNKEKTTELINTTQTSFAGMQRLIDDIAKRNNIDVTLANENNDDESDTEKIEEESKVDRSIIEKFNVDTGKIWSVGRHYLSCCDSTDIEQLRNLVSCVNDFGLVIADFPYGVNFKRGQFITDSSKKSSKIGTGEIPISIGNDDVSTRNQRDLVSNVLRNIIALSKDTISAYVFSGALKEGADTLYGIYDSGFDVKSQIIWLKSSLILGQADYQWIHENIWYAIKKKNSLKKWFGGRNKTTVMQVKKLSKTYHPNEKPEDLLVNFIFNSSEKGDVVFDPFAGSGSTLFTCEKNDRVCITCDNDKYWVAFILNKALELGLEIREII